MDQKEFERIMRNAPKPLKQPIPQPPSDEPEAITPEAGAGEERRPVGTRFSEPPLQEPGLGEAATTAGNEEHWRKP